MNNLITPDKLASILNISKPSIYRLTSERKIPYLKIRGSLRFVISDVEKYLNKVRIESIDQK